MQTAINIINLVLSVIGLVCIHLKTYTKEKHIANAVKNVVVPGAVLGVIASVFVITPITVTLRRIIFPQLLQRGQRERPYILRGLYASEKRKGARGI